MKQGTKRGVSPIIAVILLLLMTVAAAGAAYLWITKLQSLMSDSVTSSFLQSRRAQGTTFCIESVWNENDALVFTLRNCGSYDVSQAEFAQTAYYVDGRTMTASCTQNPMVTSFDVYDITTVTCAGAYVPWPCPLTTGCPTRTVKVTTVFGKSDAVIYRSGGA